MTGKQKIMMREIEALQEASVAELKEKFEELYGFPCGATNAQNLRGRLTYKLQEIFFGGLSDEDRAVLDAVANKDPASNLSMLGDKALPYVKGTRFVRPWHGKNHEVLMLDEGKYEYEGEIYRSLTAVAKKITGTHWNGKKFFAEGLCRR